MNVTVEQMDSDMKKIIACATIPDYAAMNASKECLMDYIRQELTNELADYLVRYMTIQYAPNPNELSTEFRGSMIVKIKDEKVVTDMWSIVENYYEMMRRPR